MQQLGHSDRLVFVALLAETKRVPERAQNDLAEPRARTRIASADSSDSIRLF